MLTGISIVKQAGTVVASPETAVVPYEGDPITATRPPAYIPPSDPYIHPEPMEAGAPSYQFRGEGGTPFAAINPPIYLEPYIIKRPPVDLYELADVAAPSNKPAITPPVILPGRPGELQVMPVPRGQKPTVHPIAPTVEPVQKPGPVTGTIAGFDLQKVPFWAWLAVAAFLGSRLLK